MLSGTSIPTLPPPDARTIVGKRKGLRINCEASSKVNETRYHAWVIRRARLEKTPEGVEGFRMRGTEVYRGNPAWGRFGRGPQNPSPKSLRQGFIPLGLCFMMFYGIWSRHYTYCRRYRALGNYTGYVYTLMGLVGWLHGSMHGKGHRQMVEKMEAEGRLDSNDLTDQDEVVEVLVQ